MLKKSPYDIIKSRYVTEKAGVLEQLKNNSSNPCIRACKSPKYVFLVEKKSNKQEIAEALEAIYADKNIKVVGVNIINMKRKKCAVRGRIGFKAGYKKAIVTLQEGDALEEKS
jgi:large subunit ribosomal protein L23